MKRIKALLIALTFIFSTILLHAQFDMPKLKDVQGLKDRQLIVLVNQPNQDRVNKYTRKGKTVMLQKYLQLMTDFNNNVKSAVKKFWTFNSKEILFKTRAEANDMFKDVSQRDKYCVMNWYSELGLNHDIDWSLWDNGNISSTPQMLLGIGYPGEDPVYKEQLDNVTEAPSLMYLSYLVSKVNYNFTYVFTNHADISSMKEIVFKNTFILKNKTLLIPKSRISPKLTDIGSNYHFKYKVVSDSEVNQAVIIGDPKYAYLIRTGGQPVFYINWIISCEDGAPLVYTKTGTRTVALSSNDDGLRDDFFKEIDGYCEDQKKK